MWSLPLWLIIVGYGWGAARNNPREGWSLVKIHLGIVGPSPSGDRAYTTGLGPGLRTDLSAIGYGSDEHVWIVVRRERVGLFVPWRETTDLRAISGTNSFQGLHTGTSNPAWPKLLGVVRPLFAAGNTEWSRRLLDAIDAELAGELPRSTVRPGMLAREVVVLLSHAMLFVCAALMFRSARQTWITEGWRSKGLCHACGYDRSGADGACPECGDTGPEPYHPA